MFKKILLFLLLFQIFLFKPTNSFAQEYHEEYFRGKVLEVVEDGVEELNGVSIPYQVLRVKIEEMQEEVTIEHGRIFSIKESQKVQVGTGVVIAKVAGPEGELYMVRDVFRLSNLVYIAVFFFAMVLLIGLSRGLGSIVGLVVSLAVIVRFIVPQIVAGRDPVVISILGSLVILGTTIYLAHGFKKQTHIAVVSTFVCLVLTGVFAMLFTYFAKITGGGSEDAYTLQFGETSLINLKGLFLGGVIIGALGVLDDVTTSQAASVFELKKAAPNLGLWQLFKKGMNIGREHVAAVVNTLFLAYAGSSLALFIIFSVNPLGMPTWVILNSELLGEEVVRTLAGTCGLILAIPFSTFCASWFVTRKG